MRRTFYQQRINLALKYMSEHLEKDVTIQQLANASHFSIFHFQRIYKAITSETPYESLLRLRLEKSAWLIKHRPNTPLSQISIQSGFGSYENFTRQFKKRFGHSPSVYRQDKDLQNSRIYQESDGGDYYHYIENSRQSAHPDFEVSIDHIPDIKIAMIRAWFGADGSGLIERYQELMLWAEKHGVTYTGESKRFGMSQDNIEITPASKFRYDFAVAINKEHPLEGLIEMSNIPGGDYATIHCQGDLENVAQAWDHLYKHWLPQSRYQPCDSPAIEEFIQGPEEIGWASFNLKCRVPVEPITNN